MIHTLKEVWLEVDVENVAAETLDRVVEWQDMYALSVLDVEALMNMNKVSELDTQVVTGDLVHLDLALLDVIRAQADENSVSPLLPSKNAEISTRQLETATQVRT